MSGHGKEVAAHPAGGKLNDLASVTVNAPLPQQGGHKIITLKEGCGLENKNNGNTIKIAVLKILRIPLYGVVEIPARFGYRFENKMLNKDMIIFFSYPDQPTSVTEPKLFIFGADSGSTLVPYFGSGSSFSHILHLKTVLQQ